MRRSDILDAIKTRFSGSGLPLDFVWPGRKPATSETSGVRADFCEVSIQPVQRIKRTIKNDGAMVETGLISAVVVTRNDLGENAGASIADDVSDLFPFALSMPITGGKVEISRPADIRGGFAAGDEWRTPVSIGYVATSV